jgi:hypothetical protein
MVWDSLVRQVYVSAFLNLFWGIVAVILTIVGFVYGQKFYKRYEEEGSWSPYDICAIGCYVGAGFSVFVAAICLSEAFVRFANPMYYAIQLIVG